MKRVLLGLILAGVAATAAWPALASTPLPEPAGFVNDYAQVLSADTKASLESELVAFNASTTNEVAVAIVNSLDGDYIEHYAVTLFKLWGVGTEKNDNGVLLLLAINDRKLRIEVGYGLEGALPDSVAASIIDEMTPLLKAEDYDGAVSLGVHNIMSATEGEYVATATNDGIDPDTLFGFGFFILIALQWFVAILARSKSYWAGGLVGATAGVAIATFLGWWLLGGLLLTGILVLIGFALDFAVSSAYSDAKNSGAHPPWWAGGTGAYTSSSSGSFGGFGGGSSGGGGASGGW